MTIHVNIGEAKTRLSELVAAAIRGEDVVLDKAGVPQARIIALDHQLEQNRQRIAEKRLSALGMYEHLVTGELPLIRDLKPTEEELREKYRTKFGPAD